MLPIGFPAVRRSIVIVRPIRIPTPDEVLAVANVVDAIASLIEQSHALDLFQTNGKGAGWGPTSSTETKIAELRSIADPIGITAHYAKLEDVFVMAWGTRATFAVSTALRNWVESAELQWKLSEVSTENYPQFSPKDAAALRAVAAVFRQWAMEHGRQMTTTSDVQRPTVNEILRIVRLVKSAASALERGHIDRTEPMIAELRSLMLSSGMVWPHGIMMRCQPSTEFIEKPGITFYGPMGWGHDFLHAINELWHWVESTLLTWKLSNGKSEISQDARRSADVLHGIAKTFEMAAVASEQPVSTNGGNGVANGLAPIKLDRLAAELLKVLCESHGPITRERLPTMLTSHSSTITKVAKQLIQMGLIEDAARRKGLQPTANGMAWYNVNLRGN